MTFVWHPKADVCLCRGVVIHSFRNENGNVEEKERQDLEWIQNEWMFNDTPAQKIKSVIGCQTNGIYIKKVKSNMYILNIHRPDLETKPRKI